MTNNIENGYRLIYTPLKADGTLSEPTVKEMCAKNEDEAKAMAQEEFDASGIQEALSEGRLDYGCLFFLMDGRELAQDFLWEHKDKQPKFSHVFTIYRPEWDAMPYPPPCSIAVACIDGGIREALAHASYHWQVQSPKEKLERARFELNIDGICIRDFVAEQKQETAYIAECLNRRPIRPDERFKETACKGYLSWDEDPTEKEESE